MQTKVLKVREQRLVAAGGLLLILKLEPIEEANKTGGRDAQIRDGAGKNAIAQTIDCATLNDAQAVDKREDPKQDRLIMAFKQDSERRA